LFFYQVKIVLYVVVQIRLVFFHRQNVIRLFLLDFLRYRCLAPHRVNGYRAAFHGKLVEQFVNGGNFIAEP
jgi:hypothetical protein